MSKRKETYDIEETLYNIVKLNGLYGCSEVTIGFYNNGHGNEIVDFCTMDSKGIIKCYEIKVTLADLKSKAKLSWYGHYNYLVVSKELLSKLTDDIKNEYIPKHVGIAIVNNSNSLYIVKRAKKQTLSLEDEIMIKESLVRSLSNKLNKVRNANNVTKMSELQSNIAHYNKVLTKLKYDYDNLSYNIHILQKYLKRYYDVDFDIENFYNEHKDRQKYLPESINLTLNQLGKQYNDKVSLYKEISDL